MLIFTEYLIRITWRGADLCKLNLLVLLEVTQAAPEDTASASTGGCSWGQVSGWDCVSNAGNFGCDMFRAATSQPQSLDINTEDSAGWRRGRGDCSRCWRVSGSSHGNGHTKLAPEPPNRENGEGEGNVTVCCFKRRYFGNFWWIPPGDETMQHNRVEIHQNFEWLDADFKNVWIDNKYFYSRWFCLDQNEPLNPVSKRKTTHWL